MNFSTHTLPATIQIRRAALLGLMLATAAVAAALTGVIVALAVGRGSTAASSPLSPEVQAYVNNVPLIPAIPGARVVVSSPTAGKVLPPLTAPPGAMFGPITTGKVLPPLTAPPGAMFGPITTGKVLPPLTAPPGVMFGPITTGKVLPPLTASPGVMFGPITTGR